MLSYVLFPLIGIAVALTPLVAMAGASYARAINEQDRRINHLEDRLLSGVDSQS